MTISFTVPGEPKGKGRPRFTTRGGYAKTYTPVETANYESLVRLAYFQSYGELMLEGALSLEVAAYFPIPKSASKKQQSKMLKREVLPTRRPDADNLLKVVQDALNGVAYKDDCQLASVSCSKFYSDKPLVEVTLSELEITEGAVENGK